MICRLVIITIVIANSSNDLVTNYMLIATCGIIALIHLMIKPYKNEILNKLDGMILHLIILAAALPLFDDFDSPLVITIAFVLVILPLLKFIVLILFLDKEILKKIIIRFTFRNKPSNNNNDMCTNEIPMKEFDTIVDDSTRVNVTVCDM